MSADDETLRRNLFGFPNPHPTDIPASTLHGNGIPRYESYWAKTRASEDGTRWLPVMTHALDVAAVARRHADRDPTLVNRLAASSGASPGVVRHYLIAGSAVHDVGKFSPGHQRRAPKLAQDLHGAHLSGSPDVNHVDAGWALWCSLGEGDPAVLANLASPDCAEILARPVLGHHGTPPDRAAGPADAAECFPARERADALDFIRDVMRIVLPAPPEGTLARARTAKLLAWRTSGLFVLHDWLGSDENFFPVEERPRDPRERYADALARADRALDASGVLSAAPSGRTSLRQIAPWIERPTPMQRTAEEVPIHGDPSLFIVEDDTGAGKSEAAHVLTSRLLSNGLRGVYWGMPTTATADGIYHRLAGVYRNLFAGGCPSLVLAHGRRDLNDRFMRSVRPERGDPRGDGGDADVACARWIADSSKRALLADAGAGTIDQALLAALSARHQCVRMHALAEKVLVVDEVHAHDAYVFETLKSLLTFQAAFGGAAVLLSATLPAAAKRDLVDAFEIGRTLRDDDPFDPDPVGESEIPEDAGYPLLTVADADGVRSHPVEATPRKDVPVEYLDNESDVEDALVAAADDGGCACWIRNTVADAQETYTRLRARLGADRVILFHARFAAVDRARKQEEILRRFGPDGGGRDRAGFVVVATQVVEQSLDLDFDVLATDLAPIELVLQRDGRRTRHARNAFGDRIADPSSDPRRPRLIVFGPAPSAEAGGDWYKNTFPRGAYVYGDHAALWRTARILHDDGRLRMSDGPRTLIETVHGKNAEQAPDELEEISIASLGERMAERSLSRARTVSPSEAYTATEAAWLDEERVPTRLGSPQTKLHLAIERDGEIVPLNGGSTEDEHDWLESEISIPGHKHPDINECNLKTDKNVIVVGCDGTSKNTKQSIHYSYEYGMIIT